MPFRSDAAAVTIRPEQHQAQADRDACDRLLKSIFDRGLGQRQMARVTGIPLSTVERALQRVIYPYRQDRPIGNVGDAYSQDALTWKKRRARLESLAIDQLQPTRDPTAGTPGQAPKSRIAPGSPGSLLSKIKVTRQWSCPRCRVTPQRGVTLPRGQWRRRNRPRAS